MRTLAAIRTHRWGEDEERLLASLRPVFGDDVAVAFHDRPENLKPPVRVADISGAWVADNGFRPIQKWGWQCGDYFYYRLRDAFPAYDRIWLIEPDVFFSSDPAGFFSACADAPEDVLGLRPGPRVGRGAFGDIGDLQPSRAIFALTRLSARAIDILADLRRIYCQSPPGRWKFANDETFVFSHAFAREDLTVGDMETYAPGWFDGVQFDTDPDILLEAISGEWHVPGRAYHPVRSRDSFKAALTSRFGNRINWLSGMKSSIDELDDSDIDDIASDVADIVRWRLHRIRNNRRLAAQVSEKRQALAAAVEVADTGETR